MRQPATVSRSNGYGRAGGSPLCFALNVKEMGDPMGRPYTVPYWRDWDSA